MNENLFKIGITQGDINGIGYEVILKALSDNKITELCTPIIYGISKVAGFYRNRLELQETNLQVIKKWEQLNLKKSNLLNIVDQEVKMDVGTSTEIAGKMAELSLQTACKDLKDNRIDAIVTAPVNKSNIQSPTFCFSGHTEYLAAQFASGDATMMMIADDCRVAFATNHLPIEKVSEELNTDLIINKLQIINRTLKQDFACTHPTIAVLALNPHAGDNGLIGMEEKEIIAPAIRQAFASKINAFGPFSADGFFGAGHYRKFDAVLAMYHDQGMIPFKVISGGEGVNYTAGLPIVRTSPAHGTAYDIAGKNLASCDSMRHAIYLAIDILRNRRNFEK